MFILLRLILMRFNDHRFADIPGLLFHRRQQFTEVRIHQIRQNHTNQPWTFPAKLKRTFAGNIAKISHRLPHRLTRFRDYAGVIIQDSWYGRRRDPSSFRYVFNRCHGDWSYPLTMVFTINCELCQECNPVHMLLRYIDPYSGLAFLFYWSSLLRYVNWEK